MNELSPDDRYQYLVVSHNAAGVESEESNIVDINLATGVVLGDAVRDLRSTFKVGQSEIGGLDVIA